MTKRQRDMLSELCSVCNGLGAELDGTSTNPAKYIDRQRSHRLVYNILYAVLCDDPDNDLREHDVADGKEALKKIIEVQNKQYPDRQGY